MTPDVTHTDPEGTDYGWVMQVTFLATILVGAPVVALASLFVTLPGWGERAEFAIRVGAFVWFLTGLTVFLFARMYRDQEGSDETTTKAENAETTAEADTAETTTEAEAGEITSEAETAETTTEANSG